MTNKFFVAQKMNFPLSLTAPTWEVLAFYGTLACLFRLWKERKYAIRCFKIISTL